MHVHAWVMDGCLVVGEHTHTHVCCSGSSATIHEVHRWNTVFSSCLMMMMQRQTLNRTLRLMCKSFGPSKCIPTHIPPIPPHVCSRTHEQVVLKERKKLILRFVLLLDSSSLSLLPKIVCLRCLNWFTVFRHACNGHGIMVIL